MQNTRSINIQANVYIQMYKWRDCIMEASIPRSKDKAICTSIIEKKKKNSQRNCEIYLDKRMLNFYHCLQQQCQDTLKWNDGLVTIAERYSNNTGLNSARGKIWRVPGGILCAYGTVSKKKKQMKCKDMWQLFIPRPRPCAEIVCFYLYRKHYSPT